MSKPPLTLEEEKILNDLATKIKGLIVLVCKSDGECISRTFGNPNDTLLGVVYAEIQTQSEKLKSGENQNNNLSYIG